ncbi:MAG: MFS transporter [Candidatus Dormibacteria bacterium]|jgi:MFS family permease
METASPLPGKRAGPRWLPPALRVRPYRWYWSAQWPVLLGTWMQTVALGYFVYTQTRSVNAVAFVAAASGLPALALSVFGGALADRYPRRRILLVTQSTLGLGATTLAILALSGHFSLGAIVVVAVVFGSSAAVDLPTSQALVADLVSRELVVNAMALAASAMSICRLVGPSVAGLLYAAAGPGACFACLAVAYLAPISVLLMVVPDIAPAGRAGSRRLLVDVAAGFAAAWRDPLLRGVLGAGGMLSLLGVSYMPFLPVLASSRLHVGSSGLGLMYSVGGVGGLTGALLLSTLGRGRGRRWFLVGGGVLYALSLATVARSAWLGWTLPALVGVSLAFVAINTTLITFIQTDADPAVRGRLLGLYATQAVGLQPLGTLLYSVLGFAQLFNGVTVGAVLVGASAVAVGLRGGLGSRGPVVAPPPLPSPSPLPGGPVEQRGE